jgi:hypothetical protein
MKHIELYRTFLVKESQSDIKRLIIHISGPAGSGKSYLGKKLKTEFGNEIVVKDTDDLNYDYCKINKIEIPLVEKINKKHFQKYIDELINETTQPLIITGINFFPKNPLEGISNEYYKIDAHHKFYIEIDEELVFNQKVERFFKENSGLIKIDKDRVLKDNENYVQLLKNIIESNLSFQNMSESNSIWNNHFKSEDYIFSTNDNIYQDVSKILENFLNKKK